MAIVSQVLSRHHMQTGWDGAGQPHGPEWQEAPAVGWSVCPAGGPLGGVGAAQA